MSLLQEYKVQLEVFEGPLDLLLYLIKKDELDIYDIPIEDVTNQYMEHLNVMEMLDLNIAGDFLVMAATLMMIKSRMLLPKEEQGEAEEEEEDPRWDLVRQLVEYKKCKGLALHLQERAMAQEDVFLREGIGVDLGPKVDLALEDVSVFQLISAFNKALQKVEEEDNRAIFSDRYTVAEKMEQIGTLLKEEAQLSFNGLLEAMTERSEMICTFLALLELIRLKRIQAKQSATFEEILIVRVEDTTNNNESLE